MKHLVLGALVSMTLTVQGTLSAVPPGNRFVDNVGACLGLTPCHATVSDALAAAGPSERIRIFPGVYHESVVVEPEKNDDIVLQPFFTWARPVIAAPSGIALTLYAARAQVRGLRLESPDGPGLLVRSFNDERHLAFDAVIDGNVVDAAEGIRGGNLIGVKFTRNVVSAGGMRIGGNLRCVFEENIIHGGFVAVTTAYTNSENTIRGNVVIGGDLEFTSTEFVVGNTFESNRIEGGNLHINGSDSWVAQNQLRRNVIRGGGLWMRQFGGPHGENVIELNFVSGSPGDGIAVLNLSGGHTVVRNNTSVDNAGCDLNDTGGYVENPQNQWSRNRFHTRCGAATG